MNNETILNKAIEKAVKGGYLVPFPIELLRGINFNDRILLSEYDRNNNPSIEVEADMSYHAIIFSKEFAEAFWGNEGIVFKHGRWQECDYETQRFLSESPFVYKLWQFHLREMVLKAEPLEYLGKFLGEEE